MDGFAPEGFRNPWNGLQIREQRSTLPALVKPFTGHHVYPLTHDQRLEQSDALRRDLKEYENARRSIEESYLAASHTSGDECVACQKGKHDERLALRQFYLGKQTSEDIRNGKTLQAVPRSMRSDGDKVSENFEGNRWDAHLSAYRFQMLKMLEGNASREEIHARFQKELKRHIKSDLCAIQPGDSDLVIKAKKDFAVDCEAKIFEQLPIGPIPEALTASQDPKSPRSRPDTAYLPDITKSTTNDDRSTAWQEYYCTPGYNDTPQQKSMKAKYAAEFAKGLSHDTVITMWRNEVLEKKWKEIDKLKHQLGELKMAQSAHLKNQARKAAKEQRNLDREEQAEAEAAKHTTTCGLPTCEKEVDLLIEGGALQCAICDWIAHQAVDEKRDHVYYCSPEHVEEDFDDHDHNNHACVIGESCLHWSSNGPEDTGLSVLCKDCLADRCISYFCSVECHSKNFEVHNDAYNHEAASRKPVEMLDLFRERPLDGMEIVDLATDKA